MDTTDTVGNEATVRSMAVAVSLIAGLGALGLYAATVARTITWRHGGGDGPELSAAAAVLGIAHPTGYPLYLMLGHLFTLIPVGEVAFRVGLMSATAGAVGVACAAYLAIELSSSFHPSDSVGRGLVPRRNAVDNDQAAGHRALPYVAARSEGRLARLAPLLGGLAGGAVLATSPLYWSQATIPEVYTLHAAIVLGLLTLLVAWRPGRDRLLVVTALFFGVGMGDHVTLALLALPASVFVLVRDPGVLRRRTLAFVLMAFLLGLCVYVYLPLRAAADPPLNWGDPSNASRFFVHVTARSYQGYLGGRPLAGVIGRASAMAQLLIAQLTWPGLVLALLGLGELDRGHKSLARLLLAYVGITSAFTLIYNAENPETYFIPAVLVLAVSLGVGVARLASARLERWLALAALVAIPAWQVWVNLPVMDLSHDRTAADWARQTLESAPKDGVVVTQIDDKTFALWYMQAVEHLRPDVAVVDRRLTVFDWYRTEVERRHPGALKGITP